MKERANACYGLWTDLAMCRHPLLWRAMPSNLERRSDMIIDPRAIEEIKKIKLSKRIKYKHYSGSLIKIETKFFILQTSISLDRLMKVERDIKNEIEFGNEFLEILKIEEQIKHIFEKYGHTSK